MLNESFINEALHVGHPQKVSKVARLIRSRANQDGYLSNRWSPKRQYLQAGALHLKLIKMGYHPANANELSEWIRTEVQNAYERGVFVVTDRVMRDPAICDSPKALLAALRHKEPEHFEALLWYPKNTYTEALRNERWEDDVCQTIGPLTLRYARAAFTSGLHDACEALTC